MVAMTPTIPPPPPPLAPWSIGLAKVLPTCLGDENWHRCRLMFELARKMRVGQALSQLTQDIEKLPGVKQTRVLSFEGLKCTNGLLNMLLIAM